jgi:K(+)-stimulated pyrophosphate-energized sodium pump
MNLVSLLAAPLIVKYFYGTAENEVLRYSIAAIAVVVIVAAVYVSKRRPIAIGAEAEAAEAAKV